MRNNLSDLFSIVGAGFITAAAFLISVQIGFLVLGMFLLAISYFLRS